MTRLAPLGERPIRALAWLIEQRAPQAWMDVVAAAGGFRPGYHLVIRPLERRGLVTAQHVLGLIGAQIDPTPAGRAFIATLGRCPTCGKPR